MTAQEIEQVIDLRREGVPAVDLPFDFSKEVTLWKDKYGITEVPLLVKSANGKVYDDKRLKGIFIDGNYRRIVSRNYVVLPNPEVESLLQEQIKRSNEGLEILWVKDSHFGDAKYWGIGSSESFEVESGDKVRIGCVVRNSVGANVALGADLFTFRWACSNGSIAKGSDLGSIAMKHLGKREDMMLALSKGMEKVIVRAAELVKHYRKATEIKLNQKIAEEWAKRIPQRALPDIVKVDHKTGDVTLSHTTRPNLWEAFNEITESVWHHEKSGYLTRHNLTQHANMVLVRAVQGRY